jgi:hypothetical protein
LLTVLIKIVIVILGFRFFWKKENNLTYFDKYVKEKLLVITFKKEDDFNYKVNNYRNITIKISNKSSISTINQVK